MATITLYPSATRSPNNWPLVGGGTKMSAVATHDADVTYIHSTTAHNTSQAFDVDTTGLLGPTDTITAIDIYSWCASNSGSPGRFSLQYSYDIAGGGTRSNTMDAGSTGAVGVFNLHRAIDSDLFDLFGGNLWIQINKLTGGRINCTEFYVVVTYTPATPPSTQPPRTMHQFRLRR